ncbi:carotenoid oxygenase family protein [Streptomyces sp. NPDC047981]|uniref:carotenoid oxygenase family protein n=1 Tax=Streptomyces sp. NPDC047981 TaxID=3154610 RepID=UPI00344A2E12
MFSASEGNFYLSGNFAPVEQEISAAQLPVTGSLPRDLNGRYIRIGPNPRGDVDPATYHWFTGPGMVHGIRLRDGRAEWYRSRFVEGSDGVLNTEKHAAPNTNVIAHGGRILTLIESGTPPAELDPEFAGTTVLAEDEAFGSGFTAHPKLDPATGELHAVTFSITQGTARYVVLDPEGRTKHTTDIDVDDNPMLHDMALTETRAIVLDLPVTLAAAIRCMEAGEPVSTLPMIWDEQHPARVGVLPIGGTSDQINWVEVPRCYVFHILNAFDNPDGSFTLDVVRYDELFLRDMLGPGGSVPTLVRWTVNPATGKTSEDVICDYSVEFPRIDGRLTGRPHRYGWFAGYGAGGIEITDDVERAHTRDGFETGPLVKVDTVLGVTQLHDYGPGRVTMEPAFVPRSDSTSEQDDGWILSVVHDGNVNRAELVVLDAADITAAPVARVHLPARIPFGFHGNWIDDRELGL